jgi:hypothetical protein
MSGAKVTTKRGARSDVDPAPARVPEKSEEQHPSSVAELAYGLYEERGRQEGHQLEDWIEAERRISNRQGQAGESTTEPRDDRQVRQDKDEQAR